MERPWAGAETGAGREGLRAQEVELEAEAEAVVVLGPRSVLLPSAERSRRRVGLVVFLLRHKKLYSS